MLAGVETATVGLMVAAAGGAVAAVSTSIRLLWDLTDRRRAQRARRQSDVPRVQTFTEAEMRSAIKEPVGRVRQTGGGIYRVERHPGHYARRTLRLRLVAVAGLVMLVAGVGLYFLAA